MAEPATPTLALEPGLPAPDAAPTAAPNRPLFGVALSVVAVLLFASMDTITKVLTASHHYPVPLVAWARYTVQLVLMTALLAPRQGRDLLIPSRPIPVIVRSFSLVAATLFMGLALRRLPLAEAEAIVFTSPMLVVLLAAPLLGEKLSAGRAVLAAVGFTGVLLIARPTGHLDGLGVLFALGCAVVTTAYNLMSRTLRAERPLTLLFNSALVGAVAFGILTPFSWSGDALSWSLILMFLALGLLAGVGHFLLTLSYRYAPASAIAPVSYLQLFWAGVLGVLVFGHVPDPLALLGMGIIAASGIATVVSGGRSPKAVPAVRA
ncbi:DMT family transporter [Deinococcus sp. KSM4-11]|uniref:DMT family transporter n=1 Tax=Deinococcus sp. KSM4-11 TaxID=2568654 RepID=UPI0010A32488|nr:DMT family transporter [Deinococcus sp. KSM4-11]THF87382.1 DMT family transporter [Deinococcus sp. KSM4-11]